tara:strand:- start:121 stop:225 length:105 start_codon:yes stop_codon:yes gene_type:complete
MAERDFEAKKNNMRRQIDLEIEQKNQSLRKVELL